MTREAQALCNAESLIGEYYNGIEDGYDSPFPDKDSAFEWVYSQMFDLCSNGNGHIKYRDGVCDDLKFLGHDKLYEIMVNAGIEDIVI